jgi:hypothetical protein
MDQESDLLNVVREGGADSAASEDGGTKAPKDSTAAERQRRYRERKRNEDGNCSRHGAINEGRNGQRNGVLVGHQDCIEFEYDDGGGLTLKQDQDHYREEQEIYINPDYVEAFFEHVAALAAEYREHHGQLDSWDS